MSTKTISKRVALATVVALGAGVLSLVSVSSASATNNIPVAASVANSPAPANGIMNVGVVTNNTAAGVIDITNNSSSNVSASQGLLSVSDIAGNSSPVAGTTQTATMLSSGSLVLYTDVVANGATSPYNGAVFVVSGGTLSGATGAATPVVAYNGSLTAAAIMSSASGVAGVIAKPNAGVSSMTVSMYTGSLVGSTDTWYQSQLANAPAYAAANPTLGALKGQIVVSIATSNVSGTLSQTKSGVYYATSAGGATSDITTAITANGVVQPAVGITSWNAPQYASILAKDAYGVNVASGILTASATNGALVTLTNGSGTIGTSGTASTAFLTMSAGTAGLAVKPASSAASSTIVTLAYNGTVIATKSFTFNGEVAKVVLSAPGNGLVSSSSALGNSATLVFKDSAGTVLSVGGSATDYPQTVTKDAGTTGTGVSLGTVTYPVNATTAGSVAFGCGSLNATGQIVVDYSNNDGSVITSNAVPVTCSGGATTYTAKFDKATYAPGDIATLTVTFKDSLGQLAADVAAGTAGGIASSTSGKTPNITGSNLTNTSGTSTTAGTNADVTTNGVVTYKFIVGTTTGSYQAIVDFPFVDVAGVQAGITAGYSIADGSTSLNDVLKGIVSLIASINKQIAALAKLVTKKK